MVKSYGYLFWKLSGQVLVDSFKTKLIKSRHTRIKQIRNIVTISGVAETLNNNRCTRFVKLSKFCVLYANQINKLFHDLFSHQAQIAPATQVVQCQRLDYIQALHDTILKDYFKVTLVDEAEIEEEELVAKVFLFMLAS